MKLFLRKRHISCKVTKMERPGTSKPKKSDSLKLTKLISREISGFKPYEKVAIEMIKGDRIKEAKKFLKKRLGSLKRAERHLDRLLKTVM